MAKAEVEAILKIRDQMSADVRRVDASLGKLQKTTEKNHVGIGKLAGSFIAATVAMAGARKAIEFVTGSLAKYSEQEDSVNKLNLALANQGNLLPGTSKRLQEYASELQKITTFGDETILQNQALLASFGMNEEQLKSTTAVALDFAEATGRDLSMAVNLLGKAFVGETGELSRYGVVIDKSIPKTERFDEVVKKLTERFGGQAQAATETFTGKTEQLSNAFGDLQEQVGKLFGFMVDSGDGAFTGLTDLMELMSRGVDVLIVSLGELEGMWKDSQAAAAEFVASLLDNFATLPGVGGAIGDVSEHLKTNAAQLREDAAAAREHSNEYASSSVQAKKFGNTFKQEVVPTIELAKKTSSALSKHYLADFIPSMQRVETAAEAAAFVIDTRMNPAVAMHINALRDYVPWTTNSAKAQSELTEETAKFADVLQQAANLTTVFGSGLSSILGGAASSMSGLTSLFGKEGGGFGLGGFTSQFTKAGKVGFSSILSGLSKTLPAIGAIAGPLISGIKKLFSLGGPDIGRDVARDLGVSITEGLAKSIEDNGQPVQLAIAQIFREGFASGSATADMLAQEMGDLFSGFERGEFSKPQLITALESAVPMLIQRFGELGPAGEAEIQRIIGAADRFGVTFQGLNDLMQSTFAPETMEGIAAAFGITNDQVRELADKLGIEVQTNLERMAATLGLTVEEMRSLGSAVQSEFGIPMEDIQGLLASMGISAGELAGVLGVEVKDKAAGLEGELAAGNEAMTFGANEAARMADELERAARAAGGIYIPGSGMPGMDTRSAAGGLFEKLKRDTVIFAHAGELAAIIPKGADVVSAQKGFPPTKGGRRGGGGGGRTGPPPPIGGGGGGGGVGGGGGGGVGTGNDDSAGDAVRDIAPIIADAVKAAVSQMTPVQIIDQKQINVQMPELSTARDAELFTDRTLPHMKRALRVDPGLREIIQSIARVE